MSISGKRLAVLFCPFACSPSMIDAESNELPPISKPLFELFASAENDLTNLDECGMEYVIWLANIGKIIQIKQQLCDSTVFKVLTVRAPHSKFYVGLYQRSMYNRLGYLLANMLVWTMQNRIIESNSRMWSIYSPTKCKSFRGRRFIFFGLQIPSLRTKL